MPATLTCGLAWSTWLTCYMCFFCLHIIPSRCLPKCGRSFCHICDWSCLHTVCRYADSNRLELIGRLSSHHWPRTSRSYWIIGQLSHATARWNFPGLTLSGNIMRRTYWKNVVSWFHAIFVMIGQSWTWTMLGGYYDLAESLGFGVSLFSFKMHSPTLCPCRRWNRVNLTLGTQTLWALEGESNKLMGFFRSQ